MPINRPDGRHWCAPEREEVPEDGTWECPDCGTEWQHVISERGEVWVQADQVDAFKDQEDAIAKAQAEAASEKKTVKGKE